MDNSLERELWREYAKIILPVMMHLSTTLQDDDARSSEAIAFRTSHLADAMVRYEARRFDRKEEE